MAPRKRTGMAGGPAAAIGMDYQHRVAAWFAVRILAEAGSSPSWGLPTGTTLEWLRCETEQPVDDVLVGTSQEGLLFCQVKHAPRLATARTSGLASALDQCVRQFLVCRDRRERERPWERPLDGQRDRLIIMVGPRSPESVRVHLALVLDRLRGLAKGQPIYDAAINDQERRAFSVAVNHVRRSWQAAVRTGASDGEIRALLSLLHVEVLDIRKDGPNEREAKDLLRNAVLSDPQQAEVAWTQLIELCAGFAARRSGANRREIQRALLDAGVKVHAIPSYRPDIERVRRYSLSMSQAVAHHAHIQVGPTRLKVRRRLVDELSDAVETDSVLVVGEPGAGKSGVLYDFAEKMRAVARDVVFLAADRLGARSLGQLREEIGLTHELSDILSHWPGTQPAFLVIDALDAVRDAPLENALLDIVRIVLNNDDRWRVIASVRKFDLRYNAKLRQLFSGRPPTRCQDPEFSGVRHVSVPGFSEEELAELTSQSPILQALLDGAPNELRALLRVPFNLRLVAELLSAGIDPVGLTPVRTQLDLLDRYWLYRVVRSHAGDDGRGDAREFLLRRICQEMVDARALRAERLAIVDPTTSSSLEELLRVQVLVEWQPSPAAAPDRYVLTFSHQVLFDYAVARLLLGSSHEALIERLVDDPELGVFARPSFLLHFRSLWMSDPDHQQFWGLALRMMMADGIQEIDKLIGPSVAVELAQKLSDLEVLCACLEGTEETIRDAAERALRHIVRAALVAASGERPIWGQDAGPWCELLERASRRLQGSVAYSVCALLPVLCEHAESLTAYQLACAGATARRLLEFAWSQIPRDRWLVIHGLQAVCRTFESDTHASATLLRRCLQPAHLDDHGFEEMPHLAQEVGRLIVLDPQLVAEIYRAAFSHQEVSDAPTPMSGSRMMPLISNRRQDYHMALYELAEVFPEFLERAPRHATRALLAVMESYITQVHTTVADEETQQTFLIDDAVADIRTDGSAIWDEGEAHHHDEPMKMLDAFDQHVAHLAESEQSGSQLREIVQILIAENRLAVVWRRFLLLGARFPRTLGRQLAPLAWTVPVLTGADTEAAAREFLKAVFPLLTQAERERVERTLLSIVSEESQRESPQEGVLSSLLGCLEPTDLVTEEGRRAFVDLRAVGASPSDKRRVAFEVEIAPYTEDEHLAEEGVPVEAEANRCIRDLEQPVEAFASRHLNSVPSPEEVAAVLPSLQSLREALSRADTDGVHPKLRDDAWGRLARACSRIAHVDGLPCTETAGGFVATVLLEATCNPEPLHHPEYDAQFDEFPSWGEPATRVHAAEGLVVLARHPSCATSEVLEAIEHLSADRVPAVRHHVAWYLPALHRTAPQLMWRIAERMSREEGSRGVLRGLLVGTLKHLAGRHPDRVVGLVREIFERVREGPGSGKVRELCIDIFAGLHIWRDHGACCEIVSAIASDPAAYPGEAARMLTGIEEALVCGPVALPDPSQDAVRQRAFELMALILRSASDGLRELEMRHTTVPFDAWSKEDQEEARSLARLIDEIASEIYHASGAWDEKHPAGATDHRLLTAGEKTRFYRETGAMLDQLADVGLPNVTHHLAETLETFIPLDPRGVLLRIHRAVRGGLQGAYQYESLAARLILSLTRRYLAEYRTLLREDRECRRALFDVLDVFVRAGWPEAHRLASQLDEVYR